MNAWAKDTTRQGPWTEKEMLEAQAELRTNVAANVARRIAYYNMAEYALGKVLEHFIARDDPRRDLALKAYNALFEARDAESER